MKIAGVWICVLSLGLVLSACGDDESESENETSPGTESSTEEAGGESGEENTESSAGEAAEDAGTGEGEETEGMADVEEEATPDTEEEEETEPFETTGLAAGELSAIEPGGDTICSRGTPFRFFVRGGTVNKVILDFAGGGACWDEVTCSVAGAIFNEEAPSAEDIQAALDLKLLTGIYDNENEDNPFKDWFLIHIPYCTGDIHWGNSTKKYTDSVTIEHKGYVNTQAVMDYMTSNFPDLEEVFVTGCSAGAYGAILHSTQVAEEYPEAKMTVLGDSGAGIITDQWFADSFPNWNAEAALPSWFELPGGTVEGLTIVDVYTEIANYHPNARFAQYTTAFDSNQEFYFSAMGGDEGDWSKQMFEALDEIESKTDNFTYYIPPGEVHCITPYSILYTPPATGPTVVDWIGSLLNAEDTPAPMACEGDECDDDAWCNECKESEAPGWHCSHCITD